MAEANPAAYEPGLAQSLTNLSNRLAEAGRFEASKHASRPLNSERAADLHRPVPLDDAYLQELTETIGLDEPSARQVIADLMNYRP